MEFSSCSLVHRISCIYSQLAHLSQLRWVGRFSPSGCICWKTLSRRMLDAFEFHTTTSQSHLIWNPSTFKTQLDGLAWSLAILFKYSRYIPHRDPFHRLFPVFLIIEIKHQLWPTNRHLAGIKKKTPSTDPVSCQKTGQNRAQQTTKLHLLSACFMRKIPKKILQKTRSMSPIPIEPRQPGCSCNTPPVPWLCGVFVGPFGYEWLVDFRENVLQIDGKRPERNDMGRCGNNCTSRKELYNNIITWPPKMPFQQHATTGHVPSIFF